MNRNDEKQPVTLEDEILLMKVGFHGVEALDRIIDRKLAETSKLGFTYWGYGGTLCHPRSVQLLAQEAGSRGKVVSVVFSITKSPFLSDDVQRATHYSKDGSHWELMPEAAAVTASKFALVLSNLRAVQGSIDLGAYEVAIGPSAGRCLSDYLRYRVDKALARKRSAPGPANVIPIAFTATLASPHAIWVRR